MRGQVLSSGGAPAGAQTRCGYDCAQLGWARASARTGTVICKGSLAFPGSRAAGVGPFEHLHSLWGPGTVCNVRMTPQSAAPSRKSGTCGGRVPLPVRPVEAGRHLLAGGRKAVTHERGPLVPGGLGTRSRRASFQLLHWRGERQGERTF